MSQSDCPWCGRPAVPIVAGAVLETHAPGRYIGERDCPMSGRTPDRAQEMTDEAIAYHAATGDDIEIR